MFIRLLITFAFLAVLPAQAARQALVIGNAAYTEGALKNPVNDARAMAGKLTALGFKVTKVENLKRQQIGRTLQAFASTVMPGDEVVVFYAGHGVQVKGINYLPAVDADIHTEEDVALNSLNLNTLMESLDEAKAGLKLLFLDACRNNPYARSMRSGDRGLARVSAAPSGTLIHFATRPGSVAADGTGGNGLYTSQLLRFIDSPDMPVETMLKRVTAAVRGASKQQQEPWSEGSIVGEFYFKPGVPATAIKPETVESASQIEQQGWAAAQSGNTVAGYTAYLQEYPQGRYAAAARIARASLQAQVTVVQTPPVAQIEPSTTSWVAGRVIKDCADCPEMVVTPAGRFRMGSPDSEKDRPPDGREGPVREVRIGYAFALGKHELTRGEFSLFAAASGYKTEAERSLGCRTWDGRIWADDASKNWRTPGFAQTDSHPVVCVSWNDAQAYLTWLNERAPGKGFRLPSEAEWEYAARADQGSARYPWGDDLSESLVCEFGNSLDATGKAKVPGVTLTAASCSDGHAYTAPAGSFKANAFGLHDMHGNATEWVQDTWHQNYHGAPSDGSAWLNGGDQARRVFRGGAWYSGAKVLRSAYRFPRAPDYRTSNTGMRVARTL